MENCLLVCNEKSCAHAKLGVCTRKTIVLLKKCRAELKFRTGKVRTNMYKVYHHIGCEFVMASCMPALGKQFILAHFPAGAAVQKKFKYLKDTYGRIKMQLIKGMKSGNGAKDIKDVKWKYFTQMTQIMEPSSEEPV